MVRGRRNPLHYGLAARLKKARKAAGYTRKKLADEAGVAHSLVKAIEEEGRVPLLDTVERLATALRLSPSYLAYGLDLPFVPSEGQRCAAVGARLKQAREEAGISRKELARAAQSTDTTVRLTEEGETMPSVATAEQLANALRVPLGWIAYGERGDEKGS